MTVVYSHLINTFPRIPLSDAPPSAAECTGDASSAFPEARVRRLEVNTSLHTQPGRLHTRTHHGHWPRLGTMQSEVPSRVSPRSQQNNPLTDGV
jgi:hypothetical protein